ncbi:TonB-dependent receptor [Thalassotalea sp. G2M2-11]|uniref:TonB-dependent receptor n=1 Tax=Thalassotalea sp. G2M2-11 TaxID=2787627 RepID=UPI0019D0E202|nr:TonB-dependent receptor [Thalassotalea sp. G2M2-11]
MYSKSNKTQNKVSLNVITKAILAGTLVMPVAAIAQQADNTEAESSVEVVTVTAQKRVQNVLKVPVTVGTVSAELVEESGSVLLSEVDKFIPGFEFGDGTMTQDGVKMRGIESSTISVGGDPSSASFFDDVYMPQAAHNVMFSDISRIEVLKGPQGTLFGRNAAMGVVNVLPNAPHEEFEGFVKGTFGKDNLQRYEAMVNLPASDNVFVRANYITTSQDGIVDNIAKPAWNQSDKIWDLGEVHHESARIAMLWDISPSTHFQLSYDWDNLNQAPSMAVGISEYSYSKGDPFKSKAENDVDDGKETRDMTGVIAKLTHDFNNELSMKYIVSYREWQTFNRQDEDGTADITRYFDTINHEDSDILYSELQFNYLTNDINAVAGFSYSKEKVKQVTHLTVTADSAARLITGELNNQIKMGIGEQVANTIGGNTDAHAAAAFGPGVTFAGAVDTFYQLNGFPLNHLWNSGEWANALNVLGFGSDIMAAIGMPGAPLSGDIVDATGDLTYDIVAQAMGFPEVFGPSYSGQFWRETITNTGDFTNWGVYADVDYSLSDKWHLIGGLRYSNDEKDFSWFIPQTDFAQVRPGVNNIIFPQVDLAAKDSWGQVTGRLVSSYQLDDDQMIFASYSTGYKSGGFDSLTPSKQPFEPEETTNYEIGYKAVLWDQVVANVSGYYLELDNLQHPISSKTPDSLQAVPTIINEDREITGLEFDIRWNVTPNLRLGVVSEIRSTDTFTPDFYNGEGELIQAQKTSIDAATNYTATINWIPDLGLGNTNLHVDFVFVENVNDKQAGLEEYKKSIDAYFIDREDLNARFSWTSQDDSLEIGIWGKNLLDKRYMMSIGGYAADVLGVPHGRINRGIEGGIDVKYSF